MIFQRNVKLSALLFAIGFALSITWSNFAFALNEAPRTFTLDGRIFSSPTSSTPLLGAVTVNVKILNPSGTCVLYEEEQPYNTTATKGYFNIPVGSPTSDAKRVGDDPNHTMETIYQNTALITAVNAGCGGGYTPSAGDTRLVRVTVTPALTGIPQVFSPDMRLDAVPTAVVAESIQGLSRDNMLELNTNVELTQANIENVFSVANYPVLTSLLAGTSSLYMRASPSAAVSFNGQQITNVAAPTLGTDATNKTYVDSNIGGKAADTVTFAGIAAGDAGKVMVWDGTKWTAAAPSGDATKLPLAGGTMTGAINMGSQNLLATGHITMSTQTTLNLGTYTNAQETVLVLGLGAPDAGKFWYNTDVPGLKVWNGTTAVAAVQSGTSAGGDLTGTYPNPTVAANAIVASKINDGAVTTAKILDATILGSDIASSTITDTNIAGVGAGKITSGAGVYFTYAPNNTPCADGQYMRWDNTNTRWVCGTPTDNGITALTGDVTASGNGSVAATVSNNAITNTKLAALAVTDAKVNDVSVSKISSGAGQYFSYMPGNTACADGQVLSWDNTNSRWVCASATAGSVTSIATGTGLTGGPINSVGTISIAPGGVSATELATDAVTSTKVLDGTIATIDIADNAITENKINAFAVTTPKLFANPGTNYLVMTDGIAGSTLVAKSCAVGEVLKWSVTGWGCAADSTSGGTVTAIATGTGLSGGTITGAGTLSLAAGGVSATELASNAVTAVKLNDDAVTSAKILDGTIGLNDLSTAITDGLWTANGGNVYRSSGNVGIGTTAPANNFQVYGADNSTPFNVRGSLGAGLSVEIDGSGYPRIWGAPNFQITGLRGDSYINRALRVGTNSGVVGTLAFQVDGDSSFSGNLGIGTTSPNSPLTVAGVTALGETSAPTATANYGKLYVKSADSKLYFMDDAGLEKNISDSAAGGTVTGIATGTGLTGGPIGTTGTISIASNAITTALLNDAAVTAVKLNDDAVTSAKILDGTIGLNDLSTAISDGLWTANGGDVYRASGDVGIGTTNPAFPIQVAISSGGVSGSFAGTVRAGAFELNNQTNVLDNGGMQFNSSSALTWNPAVTYWSAPADIGLARSSAGVLKVTNGSSGWGTLLAGNVGIGTTAPPSALSIQGAAATTSLFKILDNSGSTMVSMTGSAASGGSYVETNSYLATSTPSGNLTLWMNGPSSAYEGTHGMLLRWRGATVVGGAADTGVGRNAAGVVEINNGSAGSLASLVAGNLGIGTTVSNSTLTVAGVTALGETTAPTATSGYGKLYVKSSDSKLYFMDDAGVEKNISDSAAGGTVTGIATGTGLTGGPITGAGTIGLDSSIVNGLWSVNGSDIYRAGGGVGIGTSVPTGLLSIKGIWGSGSENSLAFVNSGTADRNLGIRYNLNAGSAIQLFGSNDALSAYTPVAIDGGSLLLNAALGSNGNVGIGTTSPGARLDVRMVSSDGIFIRNSSGNLRMDFGVEGGDQSRIRMRDNLGDVNTQISTNGGTPTFFAAGNVGVGTTVPRAQFDVGGKFQVFSQPSVASTTLTADVGNAGTTADVVSTAGFPDSGLIVVCSEIMSYTGKTATQFTGITRNLGGYGCYGYNGNPVFAVQSADFNGAGQVVSAQLSDGSFMAGIQTGASYSSVALGGPNTYAKGIGSIAIGPSATATGNAGVAIGAYSSATASHAQAFGYGSMASGVGSIAIGEVSYSDSYFQTVVGTHNLVSGGSPSVWVPTDPIFTVGNGQSPAAKSTAMTILKNGNAGIGTTSPNSLLSVAGVTALGETSAPTATSGYGKLYVKSSDSKLYFMDDSGAETDLLAAGGPGTVTAVAAGTGLTGGPITSNGTLSIASNAITTSLLNDAAVTAVKLNDDAVTSAKILDGTIALADLSTTVTDGFWTANGGNVYRSSGNVGIGTTSPSNALDLAGTFRLNAGTGARLEGGGYLDLYSNTGVRIFGALGAAGHAGFSSTGSFGGGYAATRPTIQIGNGGFVGAAGDFADGYGSGTWMGFNAANGFNGGLIDAQVYGVRKFSVNSNGVGYFSGNVGVGTTNSHSQLTVAGVTALGETTAPTATANYGKLYVKSSDSKLYFMDDSGAETDLLAGGGGSGTVTGIATGTGLTGGPITSAGTISLATSVTDALWTADSGNIYRTTGFVGIGTTAPIRPLAVAVSTDNTYNTVAEFLGPNVTPGHQIGLVQGKANSNGNSLVYGFTYAGSGNSLNQGLLGFYGDIPKISYRYDGYVGINTVNPGSKFSVLGNASIGNNYYAVNAPTSGLIVEGNVGVGTTSPAQALDVAGAVQATRTLTGAGTNALPAYSFTADPDTGIINSTGGQIGIVTNSSQTWNFSGASFNSSASDGPSLRQSSAGAGAPVYSIGNDSDTGMYFFSGNEAGFSTFGVPRIHMDNAGLVGIGTTDPNSKLTVDGVTALLETTAPTSTANYGKLYVKSSDSRLYFMNDSGAESDLTAASSGGIWGTNGTDVWRSSGNVGIGITNPSFPFDLNTSGYDGARIAVSDNFTTSAFFTGNLQLKNTNSTNGNWSSIKAYNSANGVSGVIGFKNINHSAGSASGEIAFSTVNNGAGAERMRITQSGNIEVYSGAIRATSGASYGSAGYSFGAGGDADGGIYSPADGVVAFVSNAAEIMRLHHNGNVGIGTTSPSSSLDVASGNLTLNTDGVANSQSRKLLLKGTGSVSNIQTASIFLDSYGPTNGQSILLKANDAGGNSVNIYDDAVILSGMTDLRSNGTLRLYSTSTTAGTYIGNYYDQTSGNVLTIADSGGTFTVVDYQGNFGIGTTAPNSKLAVNGVTALGETTAPTASSGYGKLYVKSSDSKLYFMDDSGAETDLLAGGGGGVTGIATGTGLTGGPITGTGTISLDTSVTDALWTSASGNVYRSSGNVGVGTTNPGYKLDVAGTLNTTGAISSSSTISSDGFIYSDDIISASGKINTMSYFESGSGNTTNAAFGFGGDGDTGIYRPLADTIGIITNGSDRVRITSTGNVGIGTTSPGSLFSVGNAFSVTAAGNMSANSVSSGSMSAQVYGGSVYAPTSASAISPSGVAANFDNNNASASGPFGGITLRVRNAVPNYQSSFIGSVSTAAGFNPITVIGQQTGANAYSERLRIDSNGYLGVGTTAPTVLFDAGGAGRVNGTFNVGSVTGMGSGLRPQFGVDPTSVGGTADANGRMEMWNASNAIKFFVGGSVDGIGNAQGFATRYGPLYLSSDRVSIDNTASDGGPMIFRVPATSYGNGTDFRFHGGSSELVRITSTGNLGVGTTAPNSLLTVAGITALGETTAPTASIGYGKLYVKSSDSKLYFMDDSGAEKNISDGAAGGTVTGIATGTGLTGGPISSAGTLSIASNAITASLLNDDAVASAKILDGTIAAADLASSVANGLWSVNGSDIYRDSGAVGIGTTAPSATAKLNVVSADSQSAFEIRADDSTPATWENGGFIYSLISGSSGSYSGFAGLNVQVDNARTGAGWNEARALNANGKAANDGNAQFVMGLYSTVETHASDTGYGVAVTDGTATSGGTIYGVHINLDDADATRFGIYQESANNNFFAGNVGIGTTSPTALLDVDGTARVANSYERAAANSNISGSYSVPDTTRNIRRLTLTGNSTITLPATTSIGTDDTYTLTLRVSQNGTGNYTITWAGGANSIKWEAGSAPAPSLGPNKVTIYQFTFIGGESVWYASQVWYEQ